MHGGWYTGGMGALGASSGLQGGFSTAGSLSGGVVPHSQPYHLGLGSMVSFHTFENKKLNIKSAKELLKAQEHNKKRVILKRKSEII